jgi:hypothetical protein
LTITLSLYFNRKNSKHKDKTYKQDNTKHAKEIVFSKYIPFIIPPTTLFACNVNTLQSSRRREKIVAADAIFATVKSGENKTILKRDIQIFL